MRYIQALAVFFVGIAVQWLWTTYLPILELSPQVLFILTLAVSSEAGPVVGQCYGFAWGLLLDAMSAHAFGANALLFTMSGYLVGLIRRQMDVDGSVSQVMLSAILTPAYFLLLGLIGLMFEHQFIWVGWAAFLVDPFYNCLVALISFPLIRRFVRL